MKSTGKRFKGFILDLLFPRFCFGCKKIINISRIDTYFCEKCDKNIITDGTSRCAFCPSPVSLWKVCGKCKPKHSLDYLLVSAEYADPAVKNLVKALKYRFVTIAAKDIGKIMSSYLERRASLVGIDKEKTIVTCVPLHKKRLLWRGFNQAELIAKEIADANSMKYSSNMVVRTRSIKPQADIENRNERIKNAENIFRISNSIPRCNTVLLVDDVATTGSTLDNVAKELKAGGIKKVIGFVFARN